jgi:hypothetical protein
VSEDNFVERGVKRNYGLTCNYIGHAILIVIVFVVLLMNRCSIFCRGMIFLKLSAWLSRTPTFLYSWFGGIFAGVKAARASI